MIVADHVRGARPDTESARTRWWWVAVVAAVLLFLVYWRFSWTAAANSDSAATVLQASDMLHGNWLLHGWYLSDVSFYTTENPQYLLLEVVLGVGAGVVHVAAAMSVTLIVVLTALLAAGPARSAAGPERLARALLAAVIVMSPQVTGALILLLGPDHTGTMVPVLATWLLIDRVRPRWWLPVAAGAALTWIMVADTVVLLTSIAPLFIVAVIRAIRRSGQSRRYELSLALAAAAAAGLGMLITRLITRLGGFNAWGINNKTMPLSALQHDSWNAVQAVLTLFGADVIGGQSPVEAAFTWLHLAGLLLAVAGFVVAFARFFREDSIVVPALAMAIVAELGAYLVSVHSSNLGSIREIVAVLPFGAVLAGRTLGGPALTLARSLRPRVLAAAGAAALIVLGGYLGGLGYDADRPVVPSANQDIADWLLAHHLSAGLAGYWQAGSITLDTDGQVHVGSVVIGRHDKLGVYYWESTKADFNPATRDARFVVAGGHDSVPGLAQAAIRTFGTPADVYHVGASTILVWDQNLLYQVKY